MRKTTFLLLWLTVLIMLVGCAASRKVTTSNHTEERGSTVVAAVDSVAKSETTTDSTTYASTDTSYNSGTIVEVGDDEELITEHITEQEDSAGNKTVTTDRTIHRKGSYERNGMYEQWLNHQQQKVSQLQHIIDSMAVDKRMEAGTHWAKNDSTNTEKEKNTKGITSLTLTSERIALTLIVLLGFLTYLWLSRNIK